MTFVVVSGAPGAGKSTLAAPLAARLGVSLLAFDPIKEQLADALGLGDREWREGLGRAADDVFFAVASTSASAVLDHWWRGNRADRLQELRRECVEEFCRCDDEVLVERVHRRVAAGTRHPVHADWMPVDLIAHLRQFRGAFEPLALGWPVLTVDTATDTPGLVDDVAEWVVAASPELAARSR